MMRQIPAQNDLDQLSAFPSRPAMGEHGLLLVHWRRPTTAVMRVHSSICRPSCSGEPSDTDADRSGGVLSDILARPEVRRRKPGECKSGCRHGWFVDGWRLAVDQLPPRVYECCRGSRGRSAQPPGQPRARA
jgi:hypothetical protein